MIARRFRAAVLALMLVCLFAYALPAAADTAVRMEGGLLAKGDVLWLGQISVAEDSRTYSGPIPWQVLDPDSAYDGSSGAATLLSRYTLALSEYGTPHDGWISSTIRRSMQTMAEDRSVFSQIEHDFLLPMTTGTMFPLQDDRLFALLPTDIGPDGYLTTNAERKCCTIADKSLAS